MRTTHVLLVAIALMSLSSGTMARVSEQGLLRPGCKSEIMNPGKPCDQAACSADCAKLHSGIGTCFTPAFGCDCVYCRSPSTTTSATGPTN